MLINIRYPAFISLDISNFVFKNIVNNTPTNVNITVGKTPISFIDSFIKSNTTTASIIPPDRPIKKSKYRSTFLLNKADIIPTPHNSQIWFHWTFPPFATGVSISLKIITVTQKGRSIVKFVKVHAQITWKRIFLQSVLQQLLKYQSPV